jgi:hypothetical protein
LLIADSKRAKTKSEAIPAKKASNTGHGINQIATPVQIAAVPPISMTV